MQPDNILMVIGSAFLIFRIWLVEDKLVDELQFRRHYLSRILNYYTALTWITAFKISLFNYIQFVCFPILCVSFIGWDIPFFYKFKRRTYWEKNHGWLIVERLTLHLPVLITGYYMLMHDPKSFIDLTAIFPTIIAGLILVFGPWFLWDKRWKDNYLYPIKINIMVFSIISLTGFTIYFIYF